MLFRLLADIFHSGRAFFVDTLSRRKNLGLYRSFLCPKKAIKLKESEGFSPYPYGNIELIMPMSRAVLFFCDDELYVSLTPKVRDYNYMSYIFKADFDGEKFKKVSVILQKYRK